MAMMPRGGVKRDLLILDPLFFITWLLLSVFPLTIIGVLNQSNAVLVGKTALILIMGSSGFLVALSLGFVKQQRIRFIGFTEILKNGTFLIALVLLGLTYVSQYIVFAGTGVSGHILGILDVLQARLYYSGIGAQEELFFGTALFLGLNNLIDSPYWAAFNFILNPILFGIYHIYVIGASVALLYVILPRIIFNVWYIFAAQPSPIMLAHFSWNWLVAGISASSVGLSVVGFAVSMPQLSLLSCIAPIGMIFWRVLR